MTVLDEPVIDDGGDPVWEPRGHPVRWALGVVVSTASLAVASIWFGALAPQADVDEVSWISRKGDAGEVRVVAEVTNDAHAAVDLVDAGESLPGLELTSVAVGPDADVDPRPSDYAPLDDPVTIGPGASLTVELRYRLTDCDRVPLDPPGIPFSLRTFLGRTQDRTLDSLDHALNGAPGAWAPSLLADACGTGTVVVGRPRDGGGHQEHEAVDDGALQ